LSSYVISPVMLPLLEIFFELLLWNSFQCPHCIFLCLQYPKIFILLRHTLFMETARSHLEQHRGIGCLSVINFWARNCLTESALCARVLCFSTGWSLAEHGEWSKYSNFEISVRVPLILRVPGLTDTVKLQHKEYLSSSALVELVDIFPTLVELAHLPVVPPLCPVNSSLVKLCTEGVSMVPVIYDTVFRKVVLCIQR
jgi:hypothetical protein